MPLVEKDLEMLEQSIIRLHRALSQQRRWEDITLQAGVNLDRTSAIILQKLARAGAKVYKMHEIGEELSMEAPSVTRKVQLLADAGYVVKEADSKDGRAYTLHLTREGQAVAKRLHVANRAHLKATIADWQPSERKQLARLVHKFADSLIATDPISKPTK
jgi:DNA-binding MarR family transcriptional regulator